MTVQQRATLEDVARLAGVSSKTVSRVFTTRDLVAPETVERVLAAAKRLRFRPNTLARGLRRGGGTNTIGFIIGELGNPFYYKVASGIERELAASGYSPRRGDDRRLRRGRGEGRRRAALAAHRRAAAHSRWRRTSPTSRASVTSARPVIAIDRPARNLVADSIVLENRRGTFEATRRLLARGHRRIGYVCNPASVYTQSERLRGYRDAMAAAGIPDDRAVGAARR